MAKSILAAPLCPHNPHHYFSYQNTHQFAQLWMLLYQYHAWQPESEAMLFLEQLRQLVALGYKACRPFLQRRSLYTLYRNQFLQYDHGDFRRHLSLVETFAHSMTKMVQLAMQSYQAQAYPESYEVYLQTLEAIFKNEKIILISQQEIAYQLLDELRQLY